LKRGQYKFKPLEIPLDKISFTLENSVIKKIFSGAIKWIEIEIDLPNANPVSKKNFN